MTERLDGYLSTKAQTFCPDALVYERTNEHGVVRWALVRPGQPDLDLGRDFRDAKQSIWAMRAAHKAIAEKKGGLKA